MAEAEFCDLPLELQVEICGQMTPATFDAFKKTCKDAGATFSKFKFPAHAQSYNEDVREVIQLFETMEPIKIRKELIEFADSPVAALPPARLLQRFQKIVTAKGYASTLAAVVINRAQPDVFKLACTKCCDWKELDMFPSDLIGKQEDVGLRADDDDRTRIPLITKSEIPDWLVCSHCYLKQEPGFAPGYRAIYTGWDRVQEASLCGKCDGLSLYLNERDPDEDFGDEYDDEDPLPDPEWSWERTRTRLCAPCFKQVKGKFKYITLWEKIQAKVENLQYMMRQIQQCSDHCITPDARRVMSLPGAECFKVRK